MGRAGLAIVAMLVVATASLAHATTIQSGGVRVTALAQITPFKLPRVGAAPISVTVEVNRHGLLRSRGLPVCPTGRIQPSSTKRALLKCGDALIGSGQFWASIVLPEQGSYPTHGRLLIFNGRLRGRPAILAHIYTHNPFDSSFVIPFAIKRIDRGPYGTELSASLPEALGEWGYVNRIKLTLARRYRYGGRELSYFNAGCPAVKGARRSVYPLARATLEFVDQRIAAVVSKVCGVSE